MNWLDAFAFPRWMDLLGAVATALIFVGLGYARKSSVPEHYGQQHLNTYLSALALNALIVFIPLWMILIPAIRKEHEGWGASAFDGVVALAAYMIVAMILLRLSRALPHVGPLMRDFDRARMEARLKLMPPYSHPSAPK